MERTEMGTPQFPVGLDFLRLVEARQAVCEARFDEWMVVHAGVQAPQTLEKLGTAFAYLDRLASCFWGCRGGNHQEERIVARATSNAQASLRLLRIGYYDEAYSMIRQVGELANVVALLAIQNAVDSLEVESVLKLEVSEVRNALKKHLTKQKGLIPMDRAYHEISELFTHPSQKTTPQDFSGSQPSFRNDFQEGGALASLNDLGKLVGLLLAYGVKVLQPPQPYDDLSIQASSSLLRSIGMVNLKKLRQHIKSRRSGVG